ncbi:MAG TPA: hydrolase, partial [Candidatus Aquiluna sp.]|nr:hydrolase [Aquiluna sp.]
MKVTQVVSPKSLSRVREPERAVIKVAAVQIGHNVDSAAHIATVIEAIETAVDAGAQIIFLPELTLSRYPADTLPSGVPNQNAEQLESGPTFSLISQQAKKYSVVIHASLYQEAGLTDGRGLNTAIVVGTNGELLGSTPKLHIPVTEGYFEDKYFAPGPDNNPYPVFEMDLNGRPKLGLPTCWDEWFPEVARAYALAGADILCYPTAIGSEPDHPDFDTEPLWRQVIIGHAIANGLFIVVPNRWGNEGLLDFYGSSFIVDPYGRILAQAGRSGNEVLVVELDLDQRRDWLELFPFFATRRPDTYGSLSDAVINKRAPGGKG